MEILLLFVGLIAVYLYVKFTDEKKYNKYAEDKRLQQLEVFNYDNNFLKYHSKCRQISSLICDRFPGSKLKNQEKYRIFRDKEPNELSAAGYI